MGGGGGGTQTTKTELSKEQKELMNLAMPGVKQYAANPPKLPSTPLAAPADPLQTAGQEAALAAAPNQAFLAGRGAQANDFLMGPALFPETNPALQQTINASVRPIREELLEQTLPTIRNGAVSAGQFGGSRQGVAEGIATGRAAQAVGDTAAKVATEGYQNGLDAFTRGLGLLPQTIGAQTSPAITISGVGDVRQAQQQAELSEIAQRFNYGQVAPFLVAQDLAALAAGLPGGSATTNASGARQNPLTSAIGGFSLGSALFPGMAAAGPIGAGAGALLSLLGI